MEGSPFPRRNVRDVESNGGGSPNAELLGTQNDSLLNVSMGSDPGVPDLEPALLAQGAGDVAVGGLVSPAPPSPSSTTDGSSESSDSSSEDSDSSSDSSFELDEDLPERLRREE